MKFIFLLAFACIFVLGSWAIFGGTPAQSSQFPFVVQIRTQGRVECGGSILSPNVVLTAAHCVANLTVAPEDKVKVVAGEIRRDREGFSSQTRTVKKIIIHEGFKNCTVPMNDVALLLLSYPLTLTDFVYPIAVPAANQTFETEAQLCGWGVVDEEESPAESLQTVDVRIVSGSECKEELLRYWDQYTVRVDTPEVRLELEAMQDDIKSDLGQNITTCAAGQDGASICGGDSGSPLVCYFESQAFLCGVVSWNLFDTCGESEGETVPPDVYASITHYSTWIRKWIDEFNYTCQPTEFNCGDRTCIPLSHQCNRYVDCPMATDEMNCGPCGSNKLLCATNFKCVDAAHICDGVSDCDDGSDELGCGECGVDQFWCRGTGSCIIKAHVCDGVKHCPDASDEFGCGRCSVSEFQCSNHKCVSGDRVCDGANSCHDGSDELGCGNCTKDEFRCEDSSCIPAALLCDWMPDCPDGSDEYVCSKCGIFMYECRTGACIAEGLRCDSKVDCADASDEKNCPDVTCKPWQFRCESGQCVDLNGRCDGVTVDCTDMSDEMNCDGAEANRTSSGAESTFDPCAGRMYRCDSDDCIQAFLDCDPRRECTVPLDSNDEPVMASCQSEFFPILNAGDSAVTVAPGSTTDPFACELFPLYSAYPQLLKPELAWSFNGQDITHDQTRVQINDASMGTGIQLTLQLVNVTLLDQGYYKCTATNPIGEDLVYLMLRVERDDQISCHRNLEMMSCALRGCTFIEATRECVPVGTLRRVVSKNQLTDFGHLHGNNGYGYGGVIQNTLDVLAGIGAVVLLCVACMLLSRCIRCGYRKLRSRQTPMAGQADKLRSQKNNLAEIQHMTGAGSIETQV